MALPIHLDRMLRQLQASDSSNTDIRELVDELREVSERLGGSPYKVQITLPRLGECPVCGGALPP